MRTKKKEISNYDFQKRKACLNVLFTIFKHSKIYDQLLQFATNKTEEEKKMVE